MPRRPQTWSSWPPGSCCAASYSGSGRVGAIAADAAVPGDPGRTRILLDVAANNRLVAALEKAGSVKLDRAALGKEGFRWKVASADGKAVLVITAARPVGVLYGVYLLLERLGFGFYLGGDTFPAAGSPLEVDAALDESHVPAFAVRGALPWGNLPNAAWDLEELEILLRSVVEEVAAYQARFAWNPQLTLRSLRPSGDPLFRNPLGAADEPDSSGYRRPSGRAGPGPSDWPRSWSPRWKKAIRRPSPRTSASWPRSAANWRRSTRRCFRPDNGKGSSGSTGWPPPSIG